jgi:hypothetical protein
MLPWDWMDFSVARLVDFFKGIVPRSGSREPKISRKKGDIKPKDSR